MSENEQTEIKQNSSNSADTSTIEDTPAPIHQNEAGKSEAVVPKPESRFQRTFRKFIRWLIGLLIVFGLGVIAALATWYLPARQQITQKDTQLSAANQKIEELEAQVADMTALEKQFQQALEKQKTLQLERAIQRARAEVFQAQLALRENKVDAAGQSLAEATEQISQIKALTGMKYQEITNSLEDRLALAQVELAADSYAALSDLDVLSNSLEELWNSLQSEIQ